jgi:hypothetical protein
MHGVPQMKNKKIVKNALKHPELFSEGELTFFKLWLQERKQRKLRKKKKKYKGLKVDFL